MSKLLLDKELCFLIKEHILLVKKLKNEINYLIDNLNNLEDIINLHNDKPANNCNIF